MFSRPVHVVQLRLTHDEWNHISAIAQLRCQTIEELLREELRLSNSDVQAQTPAREQSHLRLLAQDEQGEQRDGN